MRTVSEIANELAAVHKTYDPINAALLCDDWKDEEHRDELEAEAGRLRPCIFRLTEEMVQAVPVNALELHAQAAVAKGLAATVLDVTKLECNSLPEARLLHLAVRSMATALSRDTGFDSRQFGIQLDGHDISDDLLEEEAVELAARETSPSTSSSSMQQYEALKAVHPDTILMFEMGSMWEAFFDDAIQISGALGIVLNKRAAKIPMSGFPLHHDVYFDRLAEKGLVVKVCQQGPDGWIVRSVQEFLASSEATPAAEAAE